jgi:hypothetical protein
MLAIMPLVALFILFDIVVHNPTHSETKANLAMLDVASGHFALVEYASNGSLPSSLACEFAHIARQQVKDINGENGAESSMHNPFTPGRSSSHGHITTDISNDSTRHLSTPLQQELPVKPYPAD